MESSQSLTVVVDRDSVSAGDDTEPHIRLFSVSRSTTISEFLQVIKEVHFLASIQGGKATWLIDLAIKDKRSIGVVAQQWSEPRLLISADSRLIDLFADSEPKLHFRYWCQADPQLVFTCLQTGRQLPGRYE